jgi:MSHA biogenesis protein MshK
MAREKKYFVSLCTLISALATAPAIAVEVLDLVDPTRPVAFVATSNDRVQAENQLQLQAIFFGSGRREAVINGQTVKVGEFVGQAKIVAIKAGGVSFIKNGEKGELVLLPTVLQPAKVEE